MTVKIVATIGPRSRDAEMIRRLRDAGMSVARLNGSHSDLVWHEETIETLRATVPDVPILFDIPGKKIRTTQLRHEPSFSAGDDLVLTTDLAHDGTLKVPVNRADLHEYLSEGDVFFADDGTLRFTVLAVNGRDIICRADSDGVLRSAKGINVPSVRFPHRALTERDERMLDFACQLELEYVGLSFVDTAALVYDVRERIGTRPTRVLAKVENLAALENLEEVVESADAIMIDRGDLSVETSIEHVAVFQKRILKTATRLGRPVIVATEMLHSMIQHPFPTKAEVTDISNAVLDGAAALMLSGETAVGRFPVEAVRTMRRVADAVCASDTNVGALAGTSSVPVAVGEAIAMLCERLPITKIVAVTASGYAARAIAAFRPKQPILAVSNNAAVARSANLLYGTEGFVVEIPFPRDTTDHVIECVHALRSAGRLVDDDLILVTSVGFPREGNLMNMVQMHRVADLGVALGWGS